MSPRLRQEHGFSLIEVVITLSILSLMLTALYQVFAGTAKATKLSADYYRAMQVAQNRMSIMLVSSHSIGQQFGTSDGYFHWTAKKERYSKNSIATQPHPLSAATGQPNFQTYLLSVRVYWGEESNRSLNISTIRMGDE